MTTNAARGVIFRATIRILLHSWRVMRLMSDTGRSLDFPRTEEYRACWQERRLLDASDLLIVM